MIRQGKKSFSIADIKVNSSYKL